MPIAPTSADLTGSLGDLQVGARQALSNRITALGRWSLKEFESIIGSDDDRIIVGNTAVLPWRLIASLEIAMGGETSRGTGWLAGPRTIVTCGHCLVDHTTRARATAVRITPGRYKTSTPFGSVVSTRFSAPRQWTEGRLKGWDIGCIHLDEPIGDRLGWFSVGHGLPASPVGRPVRTAGYSEFDTAFGRMLRSEGVVRGLGDGRLFYTADTLDGHSGAPVWLADGRTEIPEVIALHAYDEDQSPAAAGEANSGPFLTADIANLIAQWRAV